MTALGIGDMAVYRGGWGQDEPVIVLITGVGEKNGRVVYDNDLGHWGYEDQYARIDRWTAARGLSV